MSNKILVVGSGGYGSAVAGVAKTLGCEITGSVERLFSNPEEFILVLFTGGEDVSPSYYSDRSPKGMCHCSSRRDAQEKAIFDFAVDYSIRMTGICRGSQFITAMCGGRMMHHIDGHGLGGYHGFMSKRTGDKIIEVTSTHHQMCIPGKDGHVIGWSSQKRSGVYFGRNDQLEQWDQPEVEAVFYPKFRAAAVQYHPEYMPVNSDGYLWFEAMVTDLLTKNMSDFTSLYVSKDKVQYAGAVE